MAKCEVIDLTLSDSDSDGDFIQAKKGKVKPKSLRRVIGMPILQTSCMYVVVYCSLAKLGRLICWEKLGVLVRHVNLSEGEIMYRL